MLNQFNKLSKLSQLNDLNELNSVQSQLQTRDSQRQGAAQAQYAQACELLNAYNRSLDKQTLRQCMLALTECIRASRSYAEPYLLLAYIYHALQLPQLALRYLRVADHLQTAHPLLPKLKLALSEGFQAPIVQRKSAGAGFQLLDLEEVDYDALYDEVDVMIAREVRMAMDIPVPVKPLASESLILELQGYRDGLESSLNLINGQLDVLDQEIDCARLRSKLRLLESRWRQLLALQEQCRQFLNLRSNLEISCVEILGELADPEASEKRLEVFLDRCDAFADQLDELASKNLDTSELITDYEHLVAAITQLQERLDG